MSSNDKLLSSCALAACAFFSSQLPAQTDDRSLGPGLGEDLPYANPIERAAAGANDLVYRTLDADCNPFGILDQIPSPQFSDIEGEPGDGVEPGPLCTESTFSAYLNARELAHSANELQGQGPTVASLGVDQEVLGAALRWTAAEEFAAQGSMATEFANGQLSSLAARLSALRFGAGAFRAAGNYELVRRRSPLLAQAGGSSEPAPDDGGEQYSPWGGFVNYGFGYGSKVRYEF